MKISFLLRPLFHMALLLAAPMEAHAEWSIVIHNTASGSATRMARITNNDGYTLELYRDVNNVVRSHLDMNSYNRLNSDICPTFQVDRRTAHNRSINDALCLAQPRWVEYIMGYITNNQITSTDLHNLLNGNTITYRFVLSESGYAETSFSLAGSKNVIMEVLGKNLVIFTE